MMGWRRVTAVVICMVVPALSSALEFDIDIVDPSFGDEDNPGDHPVVVRLDPLSGRPVLAYEDQDPEQGPAGLKVGRFDGKDWEFEVVVKRPNGLRTLDMELDPETGHPRILYRYAFDDPYYAEFDGSQWDFKVFPIEASKDSVELKQAGASESGQLILDAENDLVHIIHNMPDDLYMFTKFEDNWTSEVVFRKDPEDVRLYSGISAAMNPVTGDIGVAFARSLAEPPFPRGRMYYAQRTNR